jgi:hypothetical protein
MEEGRRHRHGRRTAAPSWTDGRRRRRSRMEDGSGGYERTAERIRWASSVQATGGHRRSIAPH